MQNSWEPEFDESAILMDIESTLRTFDRLVEQGFWVRAQVVPHLAKLGEPAVLPLIAMLDDEDIEVRCLAAEALGTLGDTRATKPLIAAMTSIYRGGAARATAALIRLRDTNSVLLLIELLSHAGWKVRLHAVEALGALRDERAVSPLIRMLSDSHSDVRTQAASALGKIGDLRAIPALMEALRDKDWQVCVKAAEALAGIGDPAILALVAALKDDNRDVRFRAAEALGKIGDCYAVGPLFSTLADKDWQVRTRAAEALANLGEPALSYLVNELRNSGAVARRRAAEALVKCGERAVEPLIEAIRDDDWMVRFRAAEGLGMLRDIRGLLPLSALLNDPDSDVRTQAAQSLKEIGDNGSLPLQVMFAVQLTAGQKLTILQALQNAKLGPIRVRIGPIDRYCKTLLNDKELPTATRKSVEDVLREFGIRAYTDTLLRAGDVGTGNNQLLRAVSEETYQHRPDELLRPSSPDEPEE